MAGMIEYWVYYKGWDGKFGIMGRYLKAELAEYVREEIFQNGTAREAWIETKFEPDILEGELEK